MTGHKQRVRALGIDFGERRIGLAICDPLGRFALPWQVIESKASLNQTAEYLLSIADERLCELFVVGLPLTLRGSDSAFTRIVRSFIALLMQKAPLVEVIPWDERLTTAEGERILRRDGVSRKERAARADLYAACAILQSYLDARANRINCATRSP